MNRRTFIEKTAGTTVALAVSSLPFNIAAKKGMGVASASYAIRWRSNIQSQTYPGFSHALDMLEHCSKIGAAGIQASISDEAAFAGKVRDRREELELYLEGQTRLPKPDEDISRFEGDILWAKEAGATVIRTVCLSGRRYENFASLEAFRDFQKNSIKSLELAEPVMKKHRIKLAVENHKDWRVPEFLKIMKHFESEWIGITLDTGNNLSLLEDPIEVVEALAPYTQSIHYKDMAYKEYEDGFLLSEVPLGQGVLDLKKIRAICEQHNPEVNFNLEMITRDPLKVPCLNQEYWATFDQVSGQELARMMKDIRSHQLPQSLPQTTGKDPEDQLAYEEENILASFTYAKKELGFG